VQYIKLNDLSFCVLIPTECIICRHSLVSAVPMFADLWWFVLLVIFGGLYRWHGVWCHGSLVFLTM
jgi:hypothetical protein